jgi:hypothetical protein
MPGRNLVIAGLILVTLLALGLRFYRLSNQSLWTDEISSIQTARAPLDRITEQSAKANNSLPAYFLVLRRAVGTVNTHIEFKSRWLSALAGALSVPLFIGVVFLWRGRWSVAFVAGLLLAINPLHLWYSQEARAYALMLFFGLLTLLSFELAAQRRRSGWWIVYVLSAVVGITLHKTALVFPVACGLWHAWQALRGDSRWLTLWGHLPIMLAAIAVSVLKSYPPAEGFGRPNSILEIAYTAMTFVGGYSFGPSLTEIQNYGAKPAVMQHLVQVGLLGATLLLTGLACWLRWRELARGKETALLMLGVGFVAVAALLSSFPYNVRYALPGLFGFLAMVAVLGSRSGFPEPAHATQEAGFVRFKRHALTSGLVTSVALISLWADAQWYYGFAYRKGDSRAVAQWLAENQATVKSWTVVPEYLGDAVEWYLAPHPEVRSRLQRAGQPQTTTFPPVPDVLILGRRHHIVGPDQLIERYRVVAGPVQAVHSIAGFELYARVPAK